MANEIVANRFLANCAFYRWDRRRFIRAVSKVRKCGGQMDKRLAVALWSEWKKRAAESN